MTESRSSFLSPVRRIPRFAQSAPTPAQQNPRSAHNVAGSAAAPPMISDTAMPPEPSEAEIQHTAYLLWLENGRPAGRDRENWLAAKELLRHRRGAVAAPGRRRQPLSVFPPAVPAGR
jgi:hypothetical protein